MYKCSVKSQLVLDQIISRCKADTTTENKWKGKNVLLKCAQCVHPKLSPIESNVDWKVIAAS